MDSLQAFSNGELNRGKEMKVFDWDKAARLINKEIEESGSSDFVVGAGLSGDWEWTGGIIWSWGNPNFDSYTYLSSTWATPEISIDGEEQDCYIMESETEWTNETKWPESALNILKEKIK